MNTTKEQIFTAEQLLAEANRHGGLVADMLTYAATLHQAALSAQPAEGVAGEVVAMRDAVGACCDGIQARIAELESAQPAERQGEAVAYRWRRHGRDTWHYEDWIPLAADEMRAMQENGWEVQALIRPAAPVGVPEGMVLVPREPTEAMVSMALALQGEDAFLAKAPALTSALRKIYRAMLAAAPSAPQESAQKGVER